MFYYSIYSEIEDELSSDDSDSDEDSFSSDNPDYAEVKVHYQDKIKGTVMPLSYFET